MKEELSVLQVRSFPPPPLFVRRSTSLARLLPRFGFGFILRWVSSSVFTALSASFLRPSPPRPTELPQRNQSRRLSFPFSSGRSENVARNRYSSPPGFLLRFVPSVSCDFGAFLESFTHRDSATFPLTTTATCPFLTPLPRQPPFLPVVDPIPDQKSVRSQDRTSGQC